MTDPYGWRSIGLLGSVNRWWARGDNAKKIIMVLVSLRVLHQACVERSAILSTVHFSCEDCNMTELLRDIGL